MQAEHIAGAGGGVVAFGFGAAAGGVFGFVDAVVAVRCCGGGGGGGGGGSMREESTLGTGSATTAADVGFDETATAQKESATAPTNQHPRTAMISVLALAFGLRTGAGACGRLWGAGYCCAGTIIAIGAEGVQSP